MQDNKEKLLRLIEEMKLMAPEEAMEIVEHLSANEINLLVPEFEYVLDYEKELRAFSKDVDPEGYEEIEREYREAVRELEHSFNEAVMKLQEDADLNMDAEEAKAEREVEEEAESIIEELGEIEEDIDSLTKSVTSE